MIERPARSSFHAIHRRGRFALPLDVEVDRPDERFARGGGGLARLNAMRRCNWPQQASVRPAIALRWWCVSRCGVGKVDHNSASQQVRGRGVWFLVGGQGALAPESYQQPTPHKISFSVAPLARQQPLEEAAEHVRRLRLFCPVGRCVVAACFIFTSLSQERSAFVQYFSIVPDQLRQSNVA